MNVDKRLYNNPLVPRLERLSSVLSLWDKAVQNTMVVSQVKARASPGAPPPPKAIPATTRKKTGGVGSASPDPEQKRTDEINFVEGCLRLIRPFGNEAAIEVLRRETISSRNPKPPQDTASWLTEIRDRSYLDVLVDLTLQAALNLEFLLAQAGPESNLEGIVVSPIEAEHEFVTAFRAELQALVSA